MYVKVFAFLEKLSLGCLLRLLAYLQAFLENSVAFQVEIQQKFINYNGNF